MDSNRVRVKEKFAALSKLFEEKKTRLCKNCVNAGTNRNVITIAYRQMRTCDVVKSWSRNGRVDVAFGIKLNAAIFFFKLSELYYGKLTAAHLVDICNV